MLQLIDQGMKATRIKTAVSLYNRDMLSPMHIHRLSAWMQVKNRN